MEINIMVDRFKLKPPKWVISHIKDEEKNVQEEHHVESP